MITKKEIETLSPEILTQKIIEGEVFYDNDWEVAFKRLIDLKYRLTIDELLRIDQANGNGLSLSRPLRILVNEGYSLTFEELMQLENPVRWRLAYQMALLGFSFSISELLQIEDRSWNIHGASIAHNMAEKGHFLSFDDLMRLGNPKDIYKVSVAHVMVQKGHNFTVEQILMLGDDRDIQGLSTSLLMVKNGHQFSFEEIMLLKNPKDKQGATLAHWMARYGHRFTIEELIEMGNPDIDYAENDIVNYFDMDHGGIVGHMDEEKEYNAKTYILHNGGTVAHIMAREGHRFTDEEIQKLGNPKDKAGLTISDWMERVR